MSHISHMLERFSHPSHKDTTGDYEAALEHVIDSPGEPPKDLGPTAPAPVAVLSRIRKLAASHHVGNFVAITRGPNPTQVFESMPIYVRVGIHLLYVGKEQEKLLGNTKVNAMLKAQSVRQGLAYDSTINPLDHIHNFVKTYEIDTSILLNPDLTSYKTFNEFFYRKLAPNARPIAEPENQSCISSAADCRLTVFQTVTAAQQFWIKGKNFTIKNLLLDQDLATTFEGCELAIFRLAPADYHRWHTPVNAIVGTTKSIEGDYYTVNPAAVNEDLDVFTNNKRDITQLSVPSPSGGEPIPVILVAVGAMLVGSIAHTAKPGDKLKRGEELGYFAYGGSTCIALFPRGRVQWDSDLLSNCNNSSPLETAVKVGNRIGTFI